MEKYVFQIFPEILKRQIAYPQLCDPQLGAEPRQQLAQRLISMLSIKFEQSASPLESLNEGEFTPMEFAMGEFCAFLKDCRLTAEELLEAYRMGIKKQLVDKEGKTIKIYPTLSIIQAGEVIDAYQRYKRSSSQYEKGLKMLENLRLKQNKSKQIQESPEKSRKKLIAELRQAIDENREFHGAFLLYDYVIELGGLKSFRKCIKAQKIMVNQKMINIIQRERQNKKFNLFLPTELNTLNLLLTTNPNKDAGGQQNKNLELMKKLKTLAIIEVKNMLVRRYFAKNRNKLKIES